MRLAWIILVTLCMVAIMYAQEYVVFTDGTNLISRAYGGGTQAVARTYSTNYLMYVSTTNYISQHADYAGYYYTINSNGTVRVVTNTWE